MEPRGKYSNRRSVNHCDVNFVVNIFDVESKQQLCSGLAAIGAWEDALDSFR
jgi:hypothetical protein